MAKGVYTGFYSNVNLLRSKDRNGDTPETFIVCSDAAGGRGAGKTFSWSKTLLKDRFDPSFPLYPLLDDKCTKFVLVTRRKKDLGSIAEGIVKGYLEVEDPNVRVYEKIRMGRTYSDVYCNMIVDDKPETKHIGYVVPLASADDIKRISSLFVDAWCLFIDEFMPMNKQTYLKDEPELLINIHDSIARGGGKSVRYLPVFMSSNTVSVYNPYFIAMRLHRNIQSNTKFYRGEGVVYERCTVEGLRQQHASTGFHRTFPDAKQTNYDDDNSWLNDDNSCVCKPDDWGRAEYVCTLVDRDDRLAVKYYANVGFYYIDRSVDNTCPYVYNLTLDGNLNIPFIKSSMLVDNLRKNFLKGLVRFHDGGVKSIFLDVFG